MFVYYYTYFDCSLGIGHTSNQDVVKQIVAEAKAHLAGVSSAIIKGKIIMQLMSNKAMLYESDI